MAVERDRAEFDRRNLLAQVGNHYALPAAGRGPFQVVGAAKTDDRVYFICFSEKLGIRLGQTSGHDHTGSGV